ncbi:MAG: disulfide bond formation protein B [Microthrixaceae bacterium]
MDVETVSTFFALLAVVGLLFIAVTWVTALVSKVRGGVPESLVPLREGLGQVAIPLAFAVALTCTLGSLYMSEIAKFPPCPLCWYQRIAMYPNVVLLAVAWWRRDTAVKFYVVPLVVIGWVIATYHYLLERFPDTVKSPVCDSAAAVPCETVWVWKFHFLSIPGMAWVGFTLIFTLVLLARPAPTRRGGPRTLSADGGTPDDETFDDDTPDAEPGQRAQEVTP